MLYIVVLSVAVMVLSVLTEKRWRNAALGLFFQSFMLVGTALHVGAQYGWYYPDSFPGRTLAGIIEATQPRYLHNEQAVYVERALPPEVERLREAAYEAIRTGPYPDRAYDIILRTDGTYELIRMPAYWRNGNKQRSEDFGYELALRECVADFSRARERSKTLWRDDDTVMYVEYVGGVPFSRYYRTRVWDAERVLRETYPEFFDALDAQ
ncbi:hypothetical protein FF098_010025 [Parvularcula flava]|uniref:Uncharacterized protein n=1 Tax=Aquisalinus luteolus TaxID=1566827 RepID=A0A8J3EPI1_9PROT|nr:hypothetical protein [Aquisalinus luteolus]NHK28241.1 hypothetical protein [Aquisalinus luteolus]GGH97888.1 hypothetical protein GCM10011355_20180 [Aquisalinus luteolus]